MKNVKCTIWGKTLEKQQTLFFRVRTNDSRSEFLKIVETAGEEYVNSKFSIDANSKKLNNFLVEDVNHLLNHFVEKCPLLIEQRKWNFQTFFTLDVPLLLSILSVQTNAKKYKIYS